MRIFISLLILTMGLILLACAGARLKSENFPADISIIPKPVRVERLNSDFILNTKTRILTDSPELKSIGHYLSNQLDRERNLKLNLGLQDRPEIQQAIVLSLNPSLSDSEGYELIVDNRRIRVIGGSPAGVFYGIQTFLQLIPIRIQDIDRVRQIREYAIPGVRIEDHPRFSWRGMHLDVCRHFFPKEFVKRYIDLIAMHKMNVFHWHLTEDQGWRIEIKKYPKLTEIGAWHVDRENRLWHDKEPPRPGEKASYGGFYTQEDIREIAAYAAERYITVVPEIEMPAHSMAALASYPGLSCTGEPLYVPPGHVRPLKAIFCAGNEKTFEFLEDVLSEVIDLFPSRYIHIGGDEADKENWQKCLKCQSRIRTEGLKDEEELQSYFIRRIEKFLISRNRKLVGWDEILQGGLAPEATVMSWRGVGGGMAAARQGHDVVMTPTSRCYFDFYQGLDNEPRAIGGFLPLEKVYAFEPVPPNLEPEKHRYVLGVQANLWTEYIPSPEHAEYMTLPRMCALAEVAWSPKDQKNLNDFLHRMSAHYNRLDITGVHYRKPRLSGFDEWNPYVDSVRVNAVNPRQETEIRYTLDGSDPTPKSKILKYPLWIERNLTLTTRAFNGANPLGPVKRGIFEKQTPLLSVKLNKPNPGLQYDFFEGDFSSVDELDSVTAKQSGRTTEIQVIPDVGENEKGFGVLFTGYLQIPETGVYSFSAFSDKGCRVTVSDQIVADDDGAYGSIKKSRKIPLEAGFHPIRVAYFQPGGAWSLEVGWSGPGFQNQPIPPAQLWNLTKADD